MVQPDERQEDHARPTMLAIDTSTERAGLALDDGSRILARSWDAGRTQTTSVLPAIDGLFAEAGMAPKNLGAVAIATGPGTFTGLRVGMSLAKGMVLALGIPLIGIPTLDIAAVESGECVAVLPAGRGRVVWQHEVPGEESEPRNTTVPELIEALAEMPDTLVTGELSDEHRGMIEGAHSHVRWAHRSPERLLDLARARWERGETDDPVSLEPRYVHGATVAAGPVQDRLKRT